MARWGTGLLFGLGYKCLRLPPVDNGCHGIFNPFVREYQSPWSQGQPSSSSWMGYPHPKLISITWNSKLAIALSTTCEAYCSKHRCWIFWKTKSRKEITTLNRSFEPLGGNSENAELIWKQPGSPRQRWEQSATAGSSPSPSTRWHGCLYSQRIRKTMSWCIHQEPVSYTPLTLPTICSV